MILFNFNSEDIDSYNELRKALQEDFDWLRNSLKLLARSESSSKLEQDSYALEFTSLIIQIQI